MHTKDQRNLHHQKISVQRMINEIEEIDDMSGTPLACTRLHELRGETIPVNSEWSRKERRGQQNTKNGGAQEPK